MALKVANRAQIPPFIVMDVMQAANRREALGEDILHLEVGQPSSAAPAKVLEAAADALRQDVLGYTVALGLPALREKIAAHYWHVHKQRVSPENIVITTGSSAGFLLGFLAAFEAGDRVGVAAPGYPAYRNILKALGVEPVLLPVTAKTAFQPDVATVEAAGKLDGLIVASPSNPAGSMLKSGGLGRLAGWCRENGVRLVSDEIYHGIVYGPPADSAVSFEDAIVINSFSKYYSMTGWRLGWMVLPSDLVRPVECLGQNLFISPPTLSQLAAVAVFDCIDELEINVMRYAKNRELLLNELPKAGFDDLAPADGAFYLYANVARWTNDSEIFCQRMLAETGVAATPGVDFDPFCGRQYVRFSFAGLTADMAQAAERLKAWKK